MGDKELGLKVGGEDLVTVGSAVGDLVLGLEVGREDRTTVG